MDILTSFDPDENPRLKVIKPELEPGTKCPTCKQIVERRIPRNDVLRVLTAFKMACGYKKENEAAWKNWDKVYFKRYYSQAAALLNFIGSWEETVDFIQETMDSSAEAGFRIYNFKTLVDKAHKWKLDKLERDAKP